MDNLDTYRNLLGDVDQDLIKTIEELQRQKMMAAMSSFYVFEDLPDELNYILVELVVYRFNKIGSEGMSSETKSSGSEYYISNYEEKLLDKCAEYAKNLAGDTDSWRIKLL